MEVGRLYADSTSLAVHGRYDPSAHGLPEALETSDLLRAAARERADEDVRMDAGVPTVLSATDGGSASRRAAPIGHPAGVPCSMKV